MITAERHFGGAKKVAVSGTTVRIHPLVARVWTVNCTGASSVIKLPNPADIPGKKIGLLLTIANIGNTDCDLQTSDGVSIATMQFGWTTFARLHDAEGVGTWKTNELDHWTVLS